jgi:MFS family permease
VPPPTDHPGRLTAGRAVLALGVVAVLLAAADTYVIVLALPDIMLGVGLDIDELQRAAPLVSMFLLGYVVVLPLAGRMSDVSGRLPVLVGALLVFAAGSLLTAAASGLGEAISGRFLQGAGGGALVPVTLALVADLWPPERRGLPLGVVGAVQELGAVLGPLYGAAVIAVADWRTIFWINLAAGLALAAGVRIVRLRHGGPGRTGAEPALARETGGAAGPERPARSGRRDVPGYLLAGAGLVAAITVVVRPVALESSVAWGGLLVPTVGRTGWTSPLALAALGLTAAFAARELTARWPWLDLRRAPAVLAAADLPGAVLLGSALGLVVLAFAVADPQVEFMTPAGPWLLAGSGFALAGFAWWQRRASAPLVPAAAVRARPAWGALLASVFVGAALVAVLVDVPVLARTVLPGADQLTAALVLVRFLVALPVGALLGGWLLRRLPAALVAAAGMALAAAGIGVMARWGTGSLTGLDHDAVLLGTGFGFGLAVAPINAALLAATPRATHGVASALVVTARMVGMLAGLSALTAIGLRRLYAEQARIESPAITCPQSPTNCPPYDDAVREAIVAQLQATFTGAAVCAALAAVASAVLLRTRTPSRPDPNPVTPPR